MNTVEMIKIYSGARCGHSIHLISARDSSSGPTGVVSMTSRTPQPCSTRPNIVCRSLGWDFFAKGCLCQMFREELWRQRASRLQRNLLGICFGYMSSPSERIKIFKPERVICSRMPWRVTKRAMPDIVGKSKNRDAGPGGAVPSEELISQAQRLSMDDGNQEDPDTLTREIVGIANELPITASLDEFLVAFHGKITSCDGNQVLKSLTEGRLTRHVLSFFQWMRVQEPCLVDTWTFCTVFNYLGKVDMADEALVLYKNMPEDGDFHCVQVYNSLLAALARCNRRGHIPTILQEMLDKNVELDNVTYSILITATEAGDTGRLDNVWSRFDDMLDEGQSASLAVSESLIKSFCDEGHLQQALLITVSMEKMGLFPNVAIYNMLIDAHCKAFKFEEAEGLLLDMKKLGLHPTESTYNFLINGYGRHGQIEVAEDLVVEMQNEGLQPGVLTYTSLISAFGSQKMTEKAVKVFLRMRKIGLTPTTGTYTALIYAYTEGGWHEKAQQAFDNMRREGLKPTVASYTALLNGYKHARDLEMVKYVLRMIKDDSTCELSMDCFHIALESLAKYGLYHEAREVIQEFQSRGLRPNTTTFNNLLNAASRGGLSTKLPKLLMEMQAAGCEPDQSTYCTLIYASLRIHDFMSAFQYELEMKQRGQLADRKMYWKVKHILDAKYEVKIQNDKKAAVSKKNPESLHERNSEKLNKKFRRFKEYAKHGPVRGTENGKASWKAKPRKFFP